MDTKNYINDCMWEITDDGTLVIRPANGRTEGTLHRESFFWPWYGETFKRVRIEGHVIADETDRMFCNCPALEDISRIGNLDTSKVENMFRMFSDCPAIRTLAGLEKLDTSSVTYMNCIFAGCTALKDISALSAWDIGSVQSMNGLFEFCSTLSDISALKDWDVSNVTYMNCIFAKCRALEDISAIKNWNTRNVKKMAYMFLDCAALEDISALADWDTRNVTDMRAVFSRCAALKNISALKNWDTRNVIDMSDMFRDCTALEDASVLAGWNTADVRYMDSMFRNCASLGNISGLENWNVSRILNMDLMFANCTFLKSHKTLLEKWRQKNNNFRCGGIRIVSPERLFPNRNDPMACPRTGSFTGWKKCRDGRIVKLLIPANAKRSSALDKKCRCDRAVVLEITDMDGNHTETAISVNDDEYRTGETVSVPDFDEDRFEECASGIHFFMDKTSAVNYWET